MSATKRYQHVIRPVKGDEYPSRVVCVDCDSAAVPTTGRGVAERHELAQWSAVHTRYSAGIPVRRSHGSGADRQSFWRWLDSRLYKGTLTWIVCSNAIRTLSLLGFWEELEDGAITKAGRVPLDGAGKPVGMHEVRHLRSGDAGQREVSEVQETGDSMGGVFVLEGPPVVVACTRQYVPAKLLIVDMANYGIDPPSFQGDCAERSTQIDDAMRRIIKVLRDSHLGSLRCTAGSQAAYSYRRRCITHPIYVHNFTRALHLERDAYHGGRCECFRIGRIQEKTYLLDFRQCYPYVAWHNDVPCLLRSYHEGDDARANLTEDMCAVSCADITVESGAADYPVVARLSPFSPPWPVPLQDRPFIGRDRGQVIYPVGSYRTTLSGPELADAFWHRRVIDVHRLAIYHMRPALASFMATWYALLQRARLDKDVQLQTWSKRVLVGLIGKFGETGKRWLDAPPDPQQGPYASWTRVGVDGIATRHRVIGWNHEQEEVSAESAESCPAIAAWVCSAARVRLVAALRAAGAGNVYYCDTDSIMCNQRGYDGLLAAGMVRENEIGFLRVQECASFAEVYGYRHYAIGDVAKCSGLPSGEREQCDDGARYWYHKGVKESIKSKRRPEAVRRLGTYGRGGKYLHGRVQDDGTVLPWELWR